MARRLQSVQAELLLSARFGRGLETKAGKAAPHTLGALLPTLPAPFTAARLVPCIRGSRTLPECL